VRSTPNDKRRIGSLFIAAPTRSTNPGEFDMTPKAAIAYARALYRAENSMTPKEAVAYARAQSRRTLLQRVVSWFAR
jgi:hypothetical protein